MRHTKTALLTVVSLVALASLVAGPAAAQNATNATATSTPTPIGTDTPTEVPTDGAAQQAAETAAQQAADAAESAAGGNNRDGAESNESGQQVRESIDSQTDVMRATWDKSNGTATVVLRSSSPQSVTLYDAGAFVEGGQVETRTLTADGRTTVRLPVTAVDGLVAVGVSTEKTRAYAIKISSQSHLLPQNGDQGLAMFVGLLAPVAGAVAVSKWKATRTGSKLINDNW